MQNCFISKCGVVIIVAIVASMVSFASAKEVRYFANNGDDQADGLSPQTAWRSLEKLSRDLPRGAEARFKRGDVFYGQLGLKAGFDVDHPTSATSYGEGADAEICAYKIAKPTPSVWQATDKPYLWKLDLSDFSKFDGNYMSKDGNVGFLVVDGKIYGHKLFRDVNLLKTTWDFIDDYQTLTVWCEKNPALMAKSIKIAVNMPTLRFRDYLVVSNLVFRGTGGHGACGVGRDLKFIHCGFHEIGGSCLRGYGDGVTRYGNGVECWANSTDVLVQYCAFSEVYDTAFTMQGPNPERSWRNTHVLDCVFTNCTQCTELWATQCKPDSGIYNCSFQRNTCVNTARGWAYPVRPDKTNATPLLMYSMETDNCDYLVKDNTFINTRGFLIFKSGGLRCLPETYQIINNTIVGPTNQPIAYCVGGKWIDKETAREQKIREQNKFVPAL